MTRQYIILVGVLGPFAVSPVAHGQSAGSPTVVALSGTAAPAGGNYTGFGSVNVNASGQVGFAASLGGGSSSLGLFVGAAGSLQAVALQGKARPRPRAAITRNSSAPR